jgi:hypothetical protein
MAEDEAEFEAQEAAAALETVKLAAEVAVAAVTAEQELFSLGMDTLNAARGVDLSHSPSHQPGKTKHPRFPAHMPSYATSISSSFDSSSSSSSSSSNSSSGVVQVFSSPRATPPPPLPPVVKLASAKKK